MTTRRLDSAITDGFTADAAANSIRFDQFSDIQDAQTNFYFALPPRFRGDQVAAYGGVLTFILQYTVAGGSRPSPRDVDIEITVSGWSTSSLLTSSRRCDCFMLFYVQYRYTKKRQVFRLMCL